MSEFDDRVLAHITAYPGLSAFEIGRALGVSTRENPNMSKTLYALMHLIQDRRIRWEKVRAPAPGGFKHLWYPVEEHDD